MTSKVADAVVEAWQKRQAGIDLVTVYLQPMADAGEIPLAVETSMEATLIDPDTGEESRHSVDGHRGPGGGRSGRAADLRLQDGSQVGSTVRGHARDPAVELRLPVPARRLAWKRAAWKSAR